MSQNIKQSTPSFTTASKIFKVVSESSFKPSKKCSASKNTFRPLSFRYLTVSVAIRIALSTSVSKAFVMWRLDDLPTMQTYSVSESISACTCGSSSTFTFNFLVEPKLTNFAFSSFKSFFALSKNSFSLGDAPGHPPSI